mmetsp:Transcript_31201/g.30047  ORF Transcript_31201/g.30047 Transcript_31201/m.30047 type:complete len:107 (-) Transcript_31201:161-481(-)
MSPRLTGNFNLRTTLSVFVNRRKKKRVVHESIDTCANRQCPGFADVIEVEDQLDICCIPVWHANDNRNYVCCSKCGYRVSVESYDKTKAAEMGEKSIISTIHSHIE